MKRQGNADEKVKLKQEVKRGSSKLMSSGAILCNSDRAGREEPGGPVKHVLVLTARKWLISSIQELQNLPKQKSRPKSSDYT